MAVADYFGDVQKVYVAFYQRPADPEGLHYWAQQLNNNDGDLTTIINSFADSAETARLYGEIDSSTIGDVLDSVYTALFDRLPDAEGKQFYVDGFNAGDFSAGGIVLDVLNGAQNDDLIAIQNKVEAANQFTSVLDPELDGLDPFTATYDSTDEQAARDWLQSVTSDPNSRVSDEEVENFVANEIAEPGEFVSGDTFTLTTGVDNVSPTSPQEGNQTTSGDDTIIAGVGSSGDVHTLGSSDFIDGGEGDDRLNVRLEDNQLTPDMQNVESIYAQSLGTSGNNSINLVNTTGVNAIWNDRSVDDLAVNNIQEAATLGVVEGSDTDFSVQFDTDLTGTDDALNVVTDNANLNSLAVGDGAGNSFESFAFQNTGDSNIDSMNEVGGALLSPSTINVTGSGSLDLNASTYAGLTTVDSDGVAIAVNINNFGSAVGTDTTVTSTGADDVVDVAAANGAGSDAGDAAVTTIDVADGDNDVTVWDGIGKQDISVTTGTGADTIAVNVGMAGANTDSTAVVTAGDGGDNITYNQVSANIVGSVDAGAGDDVVTLTNTMGTTAVYAGNSYAGGAGFDVIALDDANVSAVETNANNEQDTLSGFEALRVTDGLDTSFDIKSFGADVNELQLGNTVAGTQTVTGFTSGATVEYRANNDMGGQLNVGMDGATGANTPNDMLNVNLNADLTGATIDTALGVDGINILNVDATDRDNEDEATDQANGYTLTLAQEENVSTINVTGDRALTYASSGNDSALGTVAGAASTGDINVNLALFTGTEGVDITTGAGDDDIVGTQLSDTIVAGAGDDTINGDAPNTVLVDGVAQVSQLTIGSSVEDGDTFSVTINGNTYTSAGTATTAGDAAVELQTAIGTAGGDIASVDVTGSELTLNGLADGTPFDVQDVSSTNFAGEQELDQITFATETYDVGDSVSVDINGTTVSYTASSLSNQYGMANGLKDAIEAESALDGVVTATVGSYASGIVNIQADTVGTDITTTSPVLTDVAATPEEWQVTLADMTSGNVSVSVDGPSVGTAFDTDNATTATNLATAISGLTGFTASASNGVITITGPADGSSFTVDNLITTSGTFTNDGVQVDGVTVTDNTDPVLDDEVVESEPAGTDDQTITNDGVQQAPTEEVVVGGQAADTLTGGAGSDTFVFNAGDSVQGAMDVITDFEANAATTDFDTLDLGTTWVKDDIVLADQVDVATASDDATAGTDIGAIVESGIISLVGADAAEIDTLAEWSTVANDVLAVDGGDQVAAFEFDGSTYVVEEGANIIELDGTTGIVGVSTTEAQDVVHVA